MNLFAGLKSLDPAFADDQSTTWMCSLIYNGLVGFDDSLHIVPAIAKTWEITDSGTIYTFHLRSDVWFQSSEWLGTDSTRRVTAADFVYSFTRLCDPATASPGLALFNGEVKGVKDFHEGKASAIAGFRAPDDSTFVIELERPFAPFLGLLAQPMTSVVPQEVVKHYQKDFRKHPIGTGPFRMKTWNEGSSLILLRNPRYFEMRGGVQLPCMGAVQVRFIRSRLTEFMELLQGRLDFVSSVDPTLRMEVFEPDGKLKDKYKNKVRLLTGPYLNTEFLAFQTDTTLEVMQNHPLRNVKVRQALALAIDRQALVRFVMRGFGAPATGGFVPDGMPGYPSLSVPGYGYDLDRAATLLNEAGYPSGKGIPVLHLQSQAVYQPVMEFVQKSWEQLGVRVEIDNVDGPVLRKMASEGSINLWRASWIADYPDPQNYLQLFLSENVPPAGANRTRYRNPLFDQWLNEALNETDPAAQIKKYAKADSLVMQEIPVVPLFYDRVVSLVSVKVKGLRQNAMGYPNLKFVRK